MKQLLMSTDMPIADLALATGLSDAKNVARLFNQREGITPLGYRQLHGGYKKNINPLCGQTGIVDVLSEKALAM